TKGAPKTAEQVHRATDSYLSDNESDIKILLKENQALKRENARLLAELAKLAGSTPTEQAVGDTLESVLKDRADIESQIEKNRRDLEKAHAKYEALLTHAQNPEAIEAKKKELQTTRGLIAKKALQSEASN